MDLGYNHIFDELYIELFNFLLKKQGVTHRRMESSQKRENMSGRILTLLAILIIIEITLRVMSVNEFVISFQVHGLIILCILFFPAMLFINYKLFLVVRKSRSCTNNHSSTKKINVGRKLTNNILLIQ
jgi:hypothetical protein